jgi:hypothetical protein
LKHLCVYARYVPLAQWQFLDSAADVALEGEVAKVAATLQFTVSTQAREVAAETDAREGNRLGSAGDRPGGQPS